MITHVVGFALLLIFRLAKFFGISPRVYVDPTNPERFVLKLLSQKVASYEIMVHP